MKITRKDITAVSVAAKRDFAALVAKAIQRQGLTVSEVARRMGTGRTSVYRLLRGSDQSLTLGTMCRAADAVGLQIRFRLVAP